jgi:periplasmic protein TonB
MELISMLELAYPTISLDRDWFVTKPAHRSLWRWLLLSLTLHLCVLMVWELTQQIRINAVLPIQSGQQAVSVQLVSAPPKQQQTKAAQPVIAAANTKGDIAVQPKPIKNKTVTQNTNTSTPAQTKNSATTTVNVAANLTQGVYSEATPQSLHKPEYPRMAVLKNQQGKVVVKLEIDETGKSHNIQILKSSGFALLDNAVITFAQMERFIPAISNNSPVKTTQQYSFLFKLI